MLYRIAVISIYGCIDVCDMAFCYLPVWISSNLCIVMLIHNACMHHDLYHPHSCCDFIYLYSSHVNINSINQSILKRRYLQCWRLPMHSVTIKVYNDTIVWSCTIPVRTKHAYVDCQSTSFLVFLRITSLVFLLHTVISLVCLHPCAQLSPSMFSISCSLFRPLPPVVEPLPYLLISNLVCFYKFYIIILCYVIHAYDI